MEKKIQGYLHFYLGCEIALKTTYQPNTYTLGAVWDSGTVWLHKNGRIVPAEQFNMDYIMPILRPLPSMTEEELQECGNLDYDFSDDTSGLDLNNHKWQDFETILTANQFHWLISRGFDLFGLIEAGLAIDKTLHPSTIS